jgi:hypothetical protein
LALRHHVLGDGVEAFLQGRALGLHVQVSAAFIAANVSGCRTKVPAK